MAGSPYAGQGHWGDRVNGAGSVYAQPGGTRNPFASGGSSSSSSHHGGGIFGALHAIVDAPVHAAEKAGQVAGGLGQGVYDLGKLEAQALGHDAKQLVTHPLRKQSFNSFLHGNSKASKQLGGIEAGVAKNYKQRYAPLAQGKLGKFANDVRRDPVGYFLDAATVATLGGGGVAKAGRLLEKAGAISKESKLAKLGRTADITVPDFRGGKVIVKESSANPVIKGRQLLTNKALNALPEHTPVVGSTARLVKTLSRPAERAGAQVRLDSQPFEQAFAKLNDAERTAWHLKARGVTAEQYATFLRAQKGRVSPAMLKTLSNPKVARLVAHPSENLHDALTKGRALSEHMTTAKVAAGHIGEQAAAEAPYRLLRLVNGAKVTDAGIVDQPGREIERLAHEVALRGEEQPFYVPDMAVTRKGFGRFSGKSTGMTEPGAGGSAKANRGVFVSKGMLDVHGDALTREAHLFANRTEAQVLHDELVKHAAQLPKGEPLPHGYTYLKLNRGEASAPYTERVGGEFEHALDPGTADRFLTYDGSDANIATKRGNRLVVPESLRGILENRSLTYHGLAHHLLYNQPTSVWKHLVLGLRPAFFGNITVGNSILGTLQMAPGRFGVAGWLNQVVPKAERLFGKKLTAQTMRDVFPEQALGTFGHSAGYTSNKGLTLAKKAAQGVMPATIKYENVLRRAMAEGWAKATPAVRAAMAENGGDVNAALRQVAKTQPHLIDEISRRVDDALGNYRTYSKFERALKQALPFYGWDRHIVRSVARLISERPALVNAGVNVGELGHQRQEAGLGDLPSYMQGDIGLPGLPHFLGPLNGRTAVLDTHSWNPFNSAADLATIPAALLEPAGGAHSDELSSGLNPIIQALIEQATGRSLLSGAPIKGNAFLNALETVPQANVIAAATGHGKKTKPTSLYQNDLPTILAGFLGLPIKKELPQTAHLYASEERKAR